MIVFRYYIVSDQKAADSVRDMMFCRFLKENIHFYILQPVYYFMVCDLVIEKTEIYRMRRGSCVILRSRQWPRHRSFLASPVCCSWGLKHCIVVVFPIILPTCFPPLAVYDMAFFLVTNWPDEKFIAPCEVPPYIMLRWSFALSHRSHSSSCVTMWKFGVVPLGFIRHTTYSVIIRSAAMAQWSKTLLAQRPKL